MWVRGHSKSLKLVPFEIMSAVSYSPSIVTMAVSVAVCEIFNVKEWHDLENQVRGRSRSLEMAPFDGQYARVCCGKVAKIFALLRYLNNYLAIANRSRVSCAHNSSRASLVPKIKKGDVFWTQCRSKWIFHRSPVRFADLS